MKTNEFKPGDEVVCGDSSCKVVSVEGEYCILSDAAYMPENSKHYAVEFKAHFTEVEYDYGICEFEHPLDEDGLCQICIDNAEYDARSCP